MGLRVIIAGSRDFTDYNFLEEEVTRILSRNGYRRYGNVEVISGMCRGTDRLGERYAEEYGYDISKFPAEWDRLGKRAGYVRNVEMAQYASEGDIGILIAFWNGSSKGTENMIQIAKRYDLEIYVVDV